MSLKSKKNLAISLITLLSCLAVLTLSGCSFSGRTPPEPASEPVSDPAPLSSTISVATEAASSEYYETIARDFDTRRGSADILPVLMYHHLLPAEDNIYPEEPAVLNLETFEQHMAYLAAQNFTALTLKETELFLRGELEIPENSVLITFDDGYASEAVYAADVLRRYDLQASSFPITSLIEEETQPFHAHELSYLSWEQIEQNRDVFEYASHSHDLHDLENGIGKMLTCCDNSLREDLRTSREHLPAPYFAYPYGHKDSGVIQALMDKNYRMAFSTQEIYARPGDDLFRIGRFGITYHVSFDQFKQIVHGP